MSTESAAVENNRFGQTHHFFPAFEFLDDNSSAGVVEVPQQSTKIDRRLDHHGVVLPDDRNAKIICRIAMNDLFGIEIVAARELALNLRFVPMKGKNIQPADAIIS